MYTKVSIVRQQSKYIVSQSINSKSIIEILIISKYQQYINQRNTKYLKVSTELPFFPHIPPSKSVRFLQLYQFRSTMPSLLFSLRWAKWSVHLPPPLSLSRRKRLIIRLELLRSFFLLPDERSIPNPFQFIGGLLLLLVLIL